MHFEMFTWSIIGLAYLQFHRFRLHCIKNEAYIIYWPGICSLCKIRRTWVHRFVLLVRSSHSYLGDILTYQNCFCLYEPHAKSKTCILPRTCFYYFECRLPSSIYCVNPAHPSRPTCSLEPSSFSSHSSTDVPFL